MSNQRKEPRKKLMTFTPVYDLLHKTLLGYVGDLTLQGVMLIGEKPMEIGRHFTLGVEFPDRQSDTNTVRVAIPARTAWCRQTADAQNFSIGFEFMEVSPENAKVIEGVLNRYQFRHVLKISDLKS